MSPSSPAVVLLVDDQILVAEAVRRALAGPDGAGIPIAFHYCPDGREAVAAAERIGPTVILQDLVMPDIDGLGLLERYRAHPALRDVPVLVLSTKEEPRTKARAFELGANDYLVKLPDRAELQARIRFHSQSYLDRLRRDEADRALRASLQLREDFAHMVIHDLGTPLATILMDADELIASGGLTHPEAEAALARIRNNTLRLRGMSHDMLLLAKMEEGKLRIEARPGDPFATIDEAVQNLGQHLRRRGLSVRQSHAGPRQAFPYDANLILRVLDNILSNAIKFSPPSGVIEIRTRPRDGEKLGLHVEIENPGPVIPDALRERIFEKFEIGQVQRDIPQVGLGLAFCRMAVEAHGGRIEAAPDRIDGALFRFDF